MRFAARPQARQANARRRVALARSTVIRGSGRGPTSAPCGWQEQPSSGRCSATSPSRQGRLRHQAPGSRTLPVSIFSLKSALGVRTDDVRPRRRWPAGQLAFL